MSRTFALILTSLLFACGANAQAVFFGQNFSPGSASLAPVKISVYSSGTDNAYYQSTDGAISAPSLIVNLAQPFLGGNNCAWMAVSSANGLTQSTPTDNESESWQAGPSINLSGYVTWKMWYVLGDTANTRTITIATTGTGTGHGADLTSLGVIVGEVKNCNTSSIGATGTMSTAATGSAITLTLSGAPTSGDAVIAAFIDGTNAGEFQPLPNVATITEGSGFTPLVKSKSFGKMAEMDTSTTSTGVPVTFSGTDTILGVAIVIKQGSAGTSAPATKYIDTVQFENGPTSTTPTYYFPEGGNLVIGLLNSGGPYVSSMTASSGTTNVSVLETTNTTSQVVYAYNVTPSASFTISPTFNTTPESPGNALMLLSVTNANSSPFDTSMVGAGIQTSAANLSSAGNTTGTTTLTPGADGELIVSTNSIYYHTMTGTAVDGNSHTPTFIAPVDNEADDANTSCTTVTPASTLADDNEYSIFYNASDHTAITFINTGTQVSGVCTADPAGVSFYSIAAAAFK